MNDMGMYATCNARLNYRFASYVGWWVAKAK